MAVRIPQPDGAPEPARRQLPTGDLVDEPEVDRLRSHQRPAGELVAATGQHDGGERDTGSHVSETFTLRRTHR